MRADAPPAKATPCPRPPCRCSGVSHKKFSPQLAVTMITQGDGRFAKFLRLGFCPNCEAALQKESDNGLEVERKCLTCNLKITEKKDKDDGQARITGSRDDRGTAAG